MRVDTIRNYSAGGIAPKNLKTVKCRREVPQETLQCDTLSFKNRASAGAGLGALLGAGFLGLISGGVAAPAAFAVYSAVFGTAGGMLGNVLDKTEDQRIEYE